MKPSSDVAFLASSGTASRDASSDSARARMSLVASKALVADGSDECCGVFNALCERPSCNYFCVGPFVRYRETEREARGVNNARAARKFDSDCSFQIQAPGRPRPNRSEQIGPYNVRSRPFVNVANSLTSPQIPREAAHKRTHSHGRTTKKNTGSSTPMATLPM